MKRTEKNSSESVQDSLSPLAKKLKVMIVRGGARFRETSSESGSGGTRPLASAGARLSKTCSSAVF